MIMRIARTAEECDRLFAEFVKAADLDGLVSLYESAACLVHRDGTVATGHDQLRNGLSRLTTEPTEMRMRIVQMIACDTVAAGDLIRSRACRRISAFGGDFFRVLVQSARDNVRAALKDLF
ncbi:MAG: hypothetical protein DMG04_14360 [Acidobacteria bacterium]|nr:MAG: hypothetical protein DMG04_14360 [Acidobacteriota bacterium]